MTNYRLGKLLLVCYSVSVLVCVSIITILRVNLVSTEARAISSITICQNVFTSEDELKCERAKIELRNETSRQVTGLKEICIEVLNFINSIGALGIFVLFRNFKIEDILKNNYK